MHCVALGMSTVVALFPGEPPPPVRLVSLFYSIHYCPEMSDLPRDPFPYRLPRPQPSPQGFPSQPQFFSC